MSNLKQLENFEKLFDHSPGFMFDYHDFYTPNEEDYTLTQYKALTHIQKFLKYCFEKNNLGSCFQDMTIEQLSEIEIDDIQSYLKEGPIKDYSITSKKLVIQILSAFWSYFTIDSYNTLTRRPLFYRHAVNEWKVAYQQDYKNLLAGTPCDNSDKDIVYSNAIFEKMLLHFINTYPLFLDTTLKKENWKRNEDKYIAVIALLMGTGITVEELCNLNINDIDLRKKGLTLKREELVFIPIMDFAIPYITPYVKWRRNWWAASKSMPALFLNLRKQRISTSFPNQIIGKLSESYGKPLSSSIIRTSHGVNFLKETNDIETLRRIKGYTTLSRVSRYLKTG